MLWHPHAKDMRRKFYARSPGSNAGSAVHHTPVRALHSAPDRRSQHSGGSVLCTSPVDLVLWGDPKGSCFYRRNNWLLGVCVILSPEPLVIIIHYLMSRITNPALGDFRGFKPSPVRRIWALGWATPRSFPSVSQIMPLHTAALKTKESLEELLQASHTNTPPANSEVPSKQTHRSHLPILPSREQSPLPCLLLASVALRW